MAPPKLIALEEHFVSTIDGASDRYSEWHVPILSKLQSLGDERLRDMKAGSIDFQVISHAPMVANAAGCQRANDELARACHANPSKFAGFAMLPMLEPDAAATELERAVKELGFLGALINNHEDGIFYDDEKYWTVFETAVRLDVPVYLHPSFPSPQMAEHYKGNYSDQVAYMLSIASWGWHSEVGLHVLKLFAAGLFDKHPKLKLIIGHDGEMLPFMLDRTLPLSKVWRKGQRDLQTILNAVNGMLMYESTGKENIWVTTSAMFSQAPLACLLRVSDIDKILYSVDYPFVPNENGLAFVEELQQSDLVNAEQLEMICNKNAQKLLKINLKG